MRKMSARAEEGEDMTACSESGTPSSAVRAPIPNLEERTRAFALRVIKLSEAIPDTAVGRVIKGQLLRAGTSVGANYRAAKRAKSNADFISKMGTVEEEADETMYWMELLVEAGLMSEKRISELYQEANEIVSMTVASIKTARRRNSERGATNAEFGMRNSEPGIRRRE